MLGRPPDAGELPEEGVLGELPRPCGLGPVGGAEAEVPAQRVVGVVLVMGPFPLGVAVAGPRFEQEHVEAALGKLLGDDRTAAAGADHDDVAHQPLTFFRPR